MKQSSVSYYYKREKQETLFLHHIREDITKGSSQLIPTNLLNRVIHVVFKTYLLILIAARTIPRMKATVS